MRQHVGLSKCPFNPDDCYDPTRVFEHHGDYQCNPEEGGLDCLFEEIPLGYAKLLTSPLGLEGDLNDIRATGSAPLEWYYELGIKWVPNSIPHNRGIKTIDFHNFAGPGDFNPFDQNSYIFTYQSPTDHDSIFWYSGRMPYTGELLRNKLHGNKSYKLV